MSRLFVLFSFTLCVFSLKSQELIEFTFGPGYQYDIYYSLDEGLSGYAESMNWELAFSTNSQDGNIRINSGNNVELYKVSNNLLAWDQINTLEADAVQLRNSNINWELGAFVVDGDGALNYGWGMYDSEQEIIQGQSIYIINFGTQTKKIRVNSLINGEFNLTISNLDGSDEEIVMIPTSLYTDKKFIYYSISNNQIIDREPASEDWDILFTRYEEDLYANTPDEPFFYKVQGALSNNNLIAQNESIFLDDLSNLTFQSDINTIGYDWKDYQDGFSIVPNRSYYILTQDNQECYQIVFESYEGMSTGNMSFTSQSIDYNPTSLSLHSNFDFQLYPNPNNGNFYVSFNGKPADLSIIDVSGQVMYKTKISSSIFIETNMMSRGVYFLSINNNEFNIVEKFLLN